MVRIVEALHRTAFRDTLGNSIYTDAADAGELSADALRQYFYSHAVPSRLAVIGACGVSHDRLRRIGVRRSNVSGAVIPFTAHAHV